jgi:hypothetical protein
MVLINICMSVILNSFCRFIFNILTNHKLFSIFLFLITAGNAFKLPEWLDILFGLITLFAIIIWWLGKRTD